MKTYSILLFVIASLIITGCRKDQAPQTPAVCLFDGKTPITDTATFYDSYFRFRNGNSWTYTINLYRADTIYETQTQINTITGLYIVDGNYWWSYNNSTVSVLMSSGLTIYELYNRDGVGCPENHAALLQVTTDTIVADYTNGSGATVYSCYFAPVNDTIITTTDTFYTSVMKYSELYNQPNVSYFAPAIGLVYSKIYPVTSDSSRYNEAILTNYFIR